MPRREHTSKALKYGSRSQGISQSAVLHIQKVLYLHRNNAQVYFLNYTILVSVVSVHVLCSIYIYIIEIYKPVSGNIS